ncbi:retrovirus-related pol polyprotein from transposon TNT 1-94 [Tanacetum coccineum]
MLTKPQVFYDNNLKQALGFQNPFYLKKAQQVRPMLYDGNVIEKETNVISIADLEETLMLEEESRSKMLLKQKLFAEQAFWFQMSNPSIESSDPSPIKVDVPSKQPKLSLVNESLKKLKSHLTKFDSVVKTRTTPSALTKGEWGFEHTKAIFINEIIPFLKSLKDIFNVFDKDFLNKITEVQTVFDQMETAIQQYSVDKRCLEIANKQDLNENGRLLEQLISYDIMNIVEHSSENMNASVNANVNSVETCNKCLELKADLIKRYNMVEKDEYNRLSLSFSQLEQHCISLELAMQLNKENFQKNNISVNHIEPTFDQLFKVNNLKAQLQAKGITIKNLKTKIKRVSETLTSENEKVFVITALKNDLRKLKGKDIVDNAAQASNATTIAPGMYKLDPVPLALMVKNNRESHIYYLKHTMEQAANLREIVEQAKSLNLLDSESYTACKYVKLIQELLGYVRDTCPDIYISSRKLVAVTPINKKKTVRFADPIASSSNIPNVTNRPSLSSTGVKSSTSASGSKPSGNTKNDRISRPPCSSAQALCSICNECMLDANHAMCLIKHVHDMNVRAKSASKNIKNIKEWKPTGKVFNSVGYKWKPTGRTFTLVGNACPLTRITATNKVPLREPTPLNEVAQKPARIRVYTRIPKVPNSVPNSKPKTAKSMTANKMEPSSSRGSDTSVAPSSSSIIDCRLSKLFCDLEVAFRKHTCFVYNLEGVDLLSGSRGTNLYSQSIGDMMASSSICLLSKATKTKSWLWHRRLSHLNFGALNHLARNGLVRGLPRHKFEKDHLCSACAMGKSKKQSHRPKSEDTNQDKLYLLHMDLCGPMRVASVNGKKYILVIVYDYSRFTWVKFLASKDEAPDFIIKFLKMIQVRLNATVRNIHTDNETEFVNQTLKIVETIHVHFDELMAMASKQSSLEPALHEMTPATPSLGLVPNPPPSAPFVPPLRHEWDLVFQRVFDEFFSHPTSVVSPDPTVEAPAPVESTDTPSSKTVDQDAPSLSAS